MKLRLQGPDVAMTESFPSMDIDAPLLPKSRSFSKIRRSNVDIIADESLDEDLLSTPPLGARTPAKMRLSVNKRQRPELMPDEPAIDAGDLELSERRRSLFEPLGPKRNLRDRSPESLLPPPDFEAASYPRGWVVGKKRKLVNVDVVESMRRIAVHEMNRKDREIDGLTEQLEEDARTMEHLQLQLQQERQKRVQTERENSVLQGQVTMLMDMLNELEEGAEVENLDDSQVTNN